MDLFEAIKTRRSTREFSPDPVPAEDVERILDAARHAPSAGNGQPWRFLVVTDQASLQALRDRSIEAVERRIDDSEDVPRDTKPEAKAQYRDYAKGVFTAPVFVFVFVATARYPESVGYDGALAVANVLLAAHALGYGGCFQTSLFPEDLVRRHFGVPTDYRLICAVPIGRAADSPKDPGRRPLHELVWRERAPEANS
jgi:nitroreductase